MAKLAPESIVIDCADDIHSGLPYKEWASTREFDRLQKISDNLPDGEVVGALLSFPYADGYAHYLVVADEPNLTVAHVNYLDGWTLDPMMLKGMDREDVLRLLDRQKRLNALFS